MDVAHPARPAQPTVDLVPIVRRVVASQGEQRARRHAYLFAGSDGLEQHPDEFLRRVILVAHEVEGSDTATPHGHLLACDFCVDLSPALLARRSPQAELDE